ncbi:IscS subfamily cysteine desulfurase [Bacillus alveayuensis]|uniref:IscS subfamily cysteine desulfurase n=1 Tax=Aeribacillus alveayuensis TaxID=279215 RepID=UPI0005D1168F|nr:IscS subfamily cysteine desulfurase [Bacillus alveayuensis]
MIYLDYASTTPMSEKALAAYNEAAKHAFGNASSLHDIGGNAHEWLNAARNTFAKLINGKSEGVFFTSGGTESNLLALQTLLNIHSHKRHIVSSAFEHSSIRNYLQLLTQKGYRVTFLQGDETGTISAAMVERAIRHNTAFVTIQHGNSEIGVLQPIEEIGRLLKDKKIPFHTDCVQTLGKMKIDVQKMKAAAYSFSSHKVYGPKGIGAVYIDPTIDWKPLIPGTSHENGFRPGTVDVPGICSFVTAFKDFYNQREKYHQHFTHLRQLFIHEIKKRDMNITVINHDCHNQLPHIIGIIMNQMEGQYAMLELNRKGIAVSTGSACQAGMQSPSPTLLSIGYDTEKARQFIRISFGIKTTEADILTLVSVLEQLTTSSDGKD